MKTNIFKAAVLLVSLFVCGVTSIKAQDVLMATLQHDDDVQVFYGATALQKAYEAATDGDMISLSGGTFNVCNINKAVKIYGAGGFVQDAANNRYKTILNGDFTIELPEGAKGLMIEGILSKNTINVKGTASEMTLKRNRVNILNMSEASTYNCNITHCDIGSFKPDAHSKNLTLSNSVYTFRGNNSSDANLNIINCIQYIGDYMCPNAAIYKNSIISIYGSSSTVSYFNTAYTNSGINDNATQMSCYRLGSDSNINGYGLFGPNYYELKDEWKEKLIGDDGTEMGIYGGATPFTNVPSNPQVTSKEVAKQSDANGKITVKIVVEAQK